MTENQVKQSTEAYTMNVKGDIAWLKMELSQDDRKICSKVFQRFVTLRRDLSGMVKYNPCSKLWVEIRFDT